jgi:D-arabinose 1-dehydrogenase-like Zn-dependent alcohol dehydrogenase
LGTSPSQEMIDFCALHKIKPEITKIPMSGINEVWSKIVAKQARYRYVLDMNASQTKGAT